MRSPRSTRSCTSPGTRASNCCERCDSRPQPRLAGVVQGAAREGAGAATRPRRKDPPPAWPGFRPLRVTAIEQESESVISIRLAAPDGAPLPARCPGQYLTLRIQPREQEASLLRNYSLSGPPGAGLLPDQRSSASPTAPPAATSTRGSRRRPTRIAAPRGTFILDQTHAPVLLISAGIGATPVLAMLHVARADQSEREIWWLHGARNATSTRSPPRLGRSWHRSPTSHPRLLQPPGRMTSKVATSTAGRLTASFLAELDHHATPRHTSADRQRSWTRSAPALAAIGLDARDIHTEPFGPAAGLTPASPQRRLGPPCSRRRSRSRPDDRVRAQQPRDPLERRLRQPARTRRGMRRARPLVVPHRRLPYLRDDAHRRQLGYNPEPVEPPPTAARSSVAHSPATTSCSISDRQPPGQRPLIRCKRASRARARSPVRLPDHARPRRSGPAQYDQPQTCLRHRTRISSPTLRPPALRGIRDTPPAMPSGRLAEPTVRAFRATQVRDRPERLGAGWRKKAGLRRRSA